MPLIWAWATAFKFYGGFSKGLSLVGFGFLYRFLSSVGRAASETSRSGLLLLLSTWVLVVALHAMLLGVLEQPISPIATWCVSVPLPGARMH
jgi:hypothetical protein